MIFSTLVLIVAMTSCSHQPQAPPPSPGFNLEILKKQYTELVEVSLVKEQNFSKLDAEQKFNLIKNYYQSLYEPAREAYFAIPETSTFCSLQKEFEKKITRSEAIDYVEYNLWADEKFIYGGCDVSKKSYNSEFFVIYCKNNHVFLELKFFYKVSEFSKKFDPTILCQ